MLHALETETSHFSALFSTGKRFDAKFHKSIQRITESNVFNSIIILVIIVNSCCMAWQTEIDQDTANPSTMSKIFVILDDIFLAIYTIEFLMKIYAEPKQYWYSGYNIFDFFILLLSFVQSGIDMSVGNNTQFSDLRVMRSLRNLRILRTISFIRGLQVLVTALLDTIRKWVINILILLLLFMLLFAILGHYWFGYKKHDSDKKHWGDLSSAMLTLFSYVTVDGWTDIQGELDGLGMTGSAIYTITFIFLGHFIFTNVFIGVIIMNISEATNNAKREENAEKEAILVKKKEFMMQRQRNEVIQMLERQKRGDYSNFEEMVQQFEKSLRHEDSMLTSDLCANIIWIETYLHTLNHMDVTTQRLRWLHFEMANTLAAAMECNLRKKFGIVK